MTVIDVHTHFIPSFVMEEGGVLGVREEDGWLVHPEGFRYPVQPEFLDAGAKLASMDALGIDVSVLSLAPTHFFYEAPADEAVEFARRANDALAKLVAGHDRLLAFAHVPLQNADAAAAELDRAVGELGFRGAQIGTSYAHGRPLDGPELRPVLEAADRHGVLLVLHPYYVGPKAGLEPFYFTNSLGNPIETTVAAARLIHTGALDRWPSIRFVLVHAGGFLPFQIGRLDHAYEVRSEPRAKIERPPSSYLRRFWIDSVTHLDAALSFLVSSLGSDRVVLGTDLPFDMADHEPLDRLRRTGIDPHALGATAARLLGLEVAVPGA
jgi:aminocarboxymuconate-semialdehyde decarboxylase